MKELISDIIQFLFVMALMAVVLFALAGCGTYKEIPIKEVEKIVYRDSLIFVTDTLQVPVPYMVEKEILPQMDTSYLKTSLASSTAYLDTAERKIHHTLEQKGKVDVIVDTVYKSQIIEKVMTKEVPVEVEVVKYKYNSLFWISLIFNIIIILFIAFRIYLKNRF